MASTCSTPSRFKVSAKRQSSIKLLLAGFEVDWTIVIFLNGLKSFGSAIFISELTKWTTLWWIKGRFLALEMFCASKWELEPAKMADDMSFLLGRNYFLCQNKVFMNYKCKFLVLKILEVFQVKKVNIFNKEQNEIKQSILLKYVHAS